MSDKVKPEDNKKLVVSVGMSVEWQSSVNADHVLPIEITYRPKFVNALRLLAEAFDEIVSAGFARPVIVGGAAVEFYTGGAVTSGDFDVVTAAQHELEAALRRKGFERPPRLAGALLRGLHHPTLGYGVEVVSESLFDGASDKSRLRIVSLDTGELSIPPIEDMIADRMGQFCATYHPDLEMLEQAIILYQIGKRDLEMGLDEEYLDRRIAHETHGTHTLRFLSEKSDENNARTPS